MNTPLTSFTGQLRLLTQLMIIAALGSGMAGAFTPTVQKLSGKFHTNVGFDQIGSAVGMSESWIVSTAPGDDSVAGTFSAGAAYIYSASTGRFARKVRPADLATGDGFGRAVAVCGNFALIGAPGQDAGTGYLYNLSTGALVRKFISPTAETGGFYSNFGSSLALSGDYAVFGVPGENTDDGAVYVYKLATTEAPLRIAPPAPATGSYFGSALAVQGEFIIASATSSDSAATDAGAVFVFSSTGTLLHTLTDSTPSDTNYFGNSLAVSGRQILVGAPGHASDTGRVHKFHLISGASEGIITAGDGAPNDSFGSALGLSGNLAVIGAYGDSDNGSDTGSAYVFDTLTDTKLRKIYPTGSTPNANFGAAVSVWGNQAVVGAVADTDIGTYSGAAYLFRSLVPSSPLVSIARKGDAATDTQDAEFSTFSTAFINDENEGIIQAALTGPGGAGVNGVWNSLRSAYSLDVLVRSKQNLDTLPAANFIGVKPTPFGAPILCNTTYGLMQATLTGTGVNSLNNRALFVNEPLNNSIIPILRTGGNVGFGTLLQTIVDVSQAQSANFLLASITRRLNVAGINAGNDSSLFVMNHNGGIPATFDEGASAPGGGNYGQFTGRAASAMDTSFAYAGHLIPTLNATPVPAIFRGEFTGAQARLAQKGDQAAELPTGVLYSAFLAEAHQGFRTYFKATVSGTNVNATNNTGLWHDTAGLIIRTGDPIETGLTVTAIEKFWPVSNDQVLLQVMLKGTGVTAANNRALYLWQSGDTFQRLMRTGSNADPACGQGKIAGILQVGIHPSTGDYAILASLSGTGAGTNQGLWLGNSRVGDVTTRATLRLPTLCLRKGTTLLSASGQTTAIKSLSFSSTTSAAGAGNIGKGQVINAVGNVAIMIQFTNAASEVLYFVP